MRKFILLYLFISIVPFGCRENDSPVSFAIEEAVSRGEGTIIDMAKLTNFDWDKLYIFDPYSNRDIIHDAVGVEFLETYEDKDIIDNLSSYDTMTFFVFVKNSKVVHYFLHSRVRGDFAGITISYGTVQESNFKNKRLFYKLLKKGVLYNDNSNRFWFNEYFFNIFNKDYVEERLEERLNELDIGVSSDEVKLIWMLYQQHLKQHYTIEYYTPDNAKFKVIKTYYGVSGIGFIGNSGENN